MIAKYLTWILLLSMLTVGIQVHGLHIGGDISGGRNFVVNSGEFDEAKNSLENNLEGNITYSSFNELTNANLASVDLLVVESGNILTSSEQTTLENYVRNGGTVLANVFSDNCCGFNFSAGANSILNVFGLEGINGQFASSTADSVAFVDNEIINGPFGQVSSYHNKFQSEFRPQQGNTFASLGIELLVGNSSTQRARLALLPRGVLGSGQVLFFNNWHGFADADALSGGRFSQGNNEQLLLNLAASSPSSVPEPSSFLLLLAGTMLVMLSNRKKLPKLF